MPVDAYTGLYTFSFVTPGLTRSDKGSQAHKMFITQHIPDSIISQDITGGKLAAKLTAYFAKEIINA